MIYTGTQTFCQHSTRNLWYIITLTAKSRPIPCRVTTNHQLATIQGRSINLPYSFQDYVEKSYQMIITHDILFFLMLARSSVVFGLPFFRCAAMSGQ